jgi:DNA-binding CsgD family transcriptional regulator
MNPQTSIDFHYPTSVDPEQRFNEMVRATSQSKAIWELMKDGKRRTSIEVADALKFNLNSTRRAMTDLYKKYGLITKLDEMKIEQFGKNNHYYQKL